MRVEIEGDKVTLLATDRYRLAMRELAWKPEAAGHLDVALVRARTLSDAAKALGARRLGRARAAAPAAATA